MQSICNLFKIGKGPSSSHTMGPERAARLFLDRNPDADRYKVILYGSLARTGVGHGTDRVLKDILGADRTDVVLSDEIIHDAVHPNTMDLIAYTGELETDCVRVQSIGGGNIVVEGECADSSEPVYPEKTFSEIARFCEWRDITLPEYVELNEGAEVWEYLRDVWETMCSAIKAGLEAEGVLPGGLRVKRKAKQLYSQQIDVSDTQLRDLQRVCAYAFAVSEQNADNGVVVTAPTCGSCGVVPAVLYYLKEKHGFTDEQIIHALAVAGLIGNIVQCNGSISGAECGCQAEIGTATSMAAAAMGALLGYSMEEIEYAAEIAMEHQLGLTCDPICGFVQIPCIERNAVAARRAIDAANLAHLLVGSRNISFDMVVRTMYETGVNINCAYRETAEGGLARQYSRKSKAFGIKLSQC